MRENRIKVALKNGDTVIGVGLSIAASPLVVRVLANAGYDFLFIDSEHYLLSPETLVSVVQMARLCGISPIVRAQDAEYHLIANTLDSGADGIIVPRIETKEQAERIVAYSRFPPLGVRGCGTTAMLDFKRESWLHALPWLNDQTLIAMQVESAKAADNLSDILQVPGIDLVVVGPLDLSINLGAPGQFDHPRVIATIEHVLAVCRARAIPVGIVLGTPELLKPWWEKGMRFLSCGNDINHMLNGGIRDVHAIQAFTCSPKA